jgi:aspartyl-tRNA synthetase
VFQSVAQRGDFVRGIRAPQAAAQFSRKRIDELTDCVKKDFGAQGLVWFRVTESGHLESSAAKNFTEPMLEKIARRMDAEPGDVLLFVADTWEVTCKALHGLRKRLGAELKLSIRDRCIFLGSSSFRCLSSTRKSSTGAPCTILSRRRDLRTFPCSTPIRAPAQAYDLVISGYEAGAVRLIHD